MSLTSLYDGLKVAYNFNGDAKDRSGSYKHGTLVSGASIDGDNPKHGAGCLSVNGTTDYVSIPPLNFDEIAVSFWFDRSSIATPTDTVLGGWYFNADIQLQEGFDVGRFVTGAAETQFRCPLVTQTGGGFRTMLGEALAYDIGDTVGAYIHGVMTYNKVTGKQKIFIEGVLRKVYSHPAGNTIVPYTENSDMRIGSSRVNFAFFHGFIDTFYVWNRPLLDGGVAVGEYAGEEIAEVYNKGEGRELVILPKGTATGKPVIDGQREPVLSSTEQITGLSAVKGLTVPTGTRLVVIEAQGQAVRWRDDGTDPSATVGMPLLTGVPKIYTGDFSAIKFKEQTPSAELNVSYYK